mmetsp:Transcript_34401/g.78414  ORF Transcript_34401/g.78414 Transcript_34401/m.78414 type:complete len:1099 (-) Transcript_34401:121-3417(-)
MKAFVHVRLGLCLCLLSLQGSVADADDAACMQTPAASDTGCSRALLSVNTRVMRSYGPNDTAMATTVLMRSHDPNNTAGAATALEELSPEIRPRNATVAEAVMERAAKVADQSTLQASTSSLLQSPAECKVCFLAVMIFGAFAVAASKLEKNKCEDGQQNPSEDRTEPSILLDNAKVVAVLLVAFADLLQPCLDGGVRSAAFGVAYNDCATWLYGGEGLAAWLAHAVNAVGIPLFCFVSGVCSQGPVTAERSRRFLRRLVIPTAIWTALVKPLIVAFTMTTSWEAFITSMGAILTLQAITPEWYLQALVLWRGSVFVLWSHFHTLVSMGAMILVSCIAGYADFSGPAAMLKMNEVFGFLPYFAVGYTFPFVATCKWMQGLSDVRLLAVFTTVVYWTQVLMPVTFPMSLPSGHDVYQGHGLPESEWGYHLFWMQRLTRVFVEVLPMLLLLFLILPRSWTPLTWIGGCTIYPALFFPLAHAWRNSLLAAVTVPQVTSHLGHAAVLMLQAVYTVAIVSCFASRPWRQMFSWCLDPTWLEPLFGDEQCIEPVKSSRSTADVPPTKGTGAPSTSDQRQPQERAYPDVKVHAYKRNWPIRSYGNWTGAMPTWKQSEPITRMSEGRSYYPYLVPSFAFVFVLSASVGLALILNSGIQFPILLVLPVFMFAFVPGPVIYIFNYYRMKDAEALPSEAPVGPYGKKELQHVFVVVVYKEPNKVLERTVRSLVSQKGVSTPMICFATEARDESRYEMLECVKEICEKHEHRLIHTEHELKDDETVGKSSNENHAVRQVYELLVEQEKYDPYEVMVTIIDADSIVSSVYLAHVEASFQKQVDGRRLIFNGPLNTYRNLGEANLLVQYYELFRCHHDVFHNPIMTMVPQSNYSLTLGFASEMDFWTSDNMPEDLQTSYKAYLINLSLSVIPIKGMICNDSVTGLWDRYVQAKRHAWGITQVCWVLAIKKRMKMNTQAWLGLLGIELRRSTSIYGMGVRCAGQLIFLTALVMVYHHGQDATFGAKLVLALTCLPSMWRTFLMWVMEMWLWQSPALQQFDIDAPGRLNWFLLILLTPILDTLTFVLFEVIPTFDCLIHAAFYGELQYVCAPKA